MREKITSAVFIAILLILFALTVVVPKDENASVMENRPLAEMPEVSLMNIVSGAFTSEYETFLTDNIGFRSNFVKLGTEFEQTRGIQKEDSGRTVELPNGGRLVLNDGKIMEVFKKDEVSASLYVDVLNKYSKKFSDELNLYLMLVPTQIEFDNSKYRTLSDSQKETIDTIYQGVNNIKTVNVYDKLKDNINEYIYFRTDHHWTQRGAYYGYQSIMEAAGEKPVPLQKLKTNKLNGFLGYLYNQANVSEYAEYADDIEYFEGEKNYTVNVSGTENGVPFKYETSIYNVSLGDDVVTYGVFMGGDHQFAEINTDNKNGKVALVIKDSYANAVIPLLTNNYETILVIDPRSFSRTVTELTEEYSIDDIIFINYALVATFPDFINSIENIM